MELEIKEILTANSKNVIPHLRKRFVKDTAVPINVYDSPYFEERLHMFDNGYNTLTKYNNYMHALKEYGYEIQTYLQDITNCAEKVIGHITGKKVYDMLINDSTLAKKINDYTPVVPSVNLYNQENAKHDDNLYVSFDLKSANFQALRSYSPSLVDELDDYESFIRQFTSCDNIITSKHFRQVIFGKLNPKRIMWVEKLLISKLYQWLIDNTNILSVYEPLSMNFDEVIFKKRSDVSDTDLFNKVNHELVTADISAKSNVDAKVEFFELDFYSFTSDPEKLKNMKYVYVKRLHTTSDRVKYKCVDSAYFPQTYKLINGLEINDGDMVINYSNGELAKLITPLRQV